MRYRRLGRSGLDVSEIGFGAWGIGGRTAGLTSYGETDDATSIAALRRALDVGINFFDTSTAYGDGRSEKLIGRAFRHDRHRVVIATKAGISNWSEPPDFSRDAVVRSLDTSLRRLETNYVDLFQLHNPRPQDITDDLLDTLRILVTAGKARAWGLSMRSPEDALTALRRAYAPAIQVNLNMMDVRAVESGLLDLAREKETGIIARTPLCFGFLSGTYRDDSQFPPGDHRRLWSPEQIQRWIDGAKEALTISSVGAESTETQAALRFCLSFEAVSSVIPGMLSPSEVTENAKSSELGPLSADVVNALLCFNRTHPIFTNDKSRNDD